MLGRFATCLFYFPPAASRAPSPRVGLLDYLYRAHRSLSSRKRSRESLPSPEGRNSTRRCLIRSNAASRRRLRWIRVTTSVIRLMTSSPIERRSSRANAFNVSYNPLGKFRTTSVAITLPSWRILYLAPAICKQIFLAILGKTPMMAIPAHSSCSYFEPVRIFLSRSRSRKKEQDSTTRRRTVSVLTPRRTP